MKKSLFFSAVALCALTITGCNKEVESPEVTPKGCEIHFTINAGAPETKTFIEYDNVNHKYVPKWQNSDKLGVIFNAFGESKKAADAEFTNTLADGATASFSGTGTVSGDEQTLYAFYPASAFGKAYSGSVIGLDIPDTQKPTATSFDPAADILVNDPYALTIDDANVVISDMQFRRVGSVLRLTITDGTSTGRISSDKIKTVTVSSNMANAAFAGRYRYDFVGIMGQSMSTWQARLLLLLQILQTIFSLSAIPFSLSSTLRIWRQTLSLPFKSLLIIIISQRR